MDTRRILAAAVVGCLTASLAPASAQAAGPTLDEQFSSWPKGSNWNANRTVRVNGDWTGTGGNQLLRSNVNFTRGAAVMTSRAHKLSGAELQTAPDKLLGNGYYEASMLMSSTPGILSGIFFKAENYGFPEVDIEIRSRDNGAGKKHYAFYTVHFANGGHQYKQVELPFDPATGYHTYGFLMGHTSLSFYADGQHTHTWKNLPANLGAPAEPKGYLMTNSWAQPGEWVGALPTSDTATKVSWMRHWADAGKPHFTKR